MLATILQRYSSAMPSTGSIILAISMLHAIITVFTTFGNQVPAFILPTVTVITLLTLISAPTTSAPHSIHGYMATPVVVGYPRAPFDRIVETIKVLIAYAVGFNYFYKWHSIINPHLTTASAVSLFWRFVILPSANGIATVFSRVGGPQLATNIVMCVSETLQAIWIAAFSTSEWTGASQPVSSPIETLATYGTFIQCLPSVLSLSLVTFMVIMSDTHWSLMRVKSIFRTSRDITSPFQRYNRHTAGVMHTFKSYSLPKAFRLDLHFCPSSVSHASSPGLNNVDRPKVAHSACQLLFPTQRSAPDFSHLIAHRPVRFGRPVVPEQGDVLGQRRSVKTLDWRACGLSPPKEKKPAASSKTFVPTEISPEPPAPTLAPITPLQRPSVYKFGPFPPHRQFQTKRSQPAKRVSFATAFDKFPAEPKGISKATMSVSMPPLADDEAALHSNSTLATGATRDSTILSAKTLVPESSHLFVSTTEVSSADAKCLTGPASHAQAQVACMPITDSSAIALPAVNLAVVAQASLQPIQPIALPSPTPSTPTPSTAPRKTWRPTSTGFSFAAPPLLAKIAKPALDFSSSVSAGTPQSFVFGGAPKPALAVVMPEQSPAPMLMSPLPVEVLLDMEVSFAPEWDMLSTPIEARAPPPAYRDVLSEVEVRRLEEAVTSLRRDSLESHHLELPPYQDTSDDGELAGILARLSLDDTMECEGPGASAPKSLIRAWAVHRPRGKDHAARNPRTHFASRHPAVKDVFELRASKELHQDAKLQNNRRSMQDLRLVAAGTGSKPNVSTWVGRVCWRLAHPQAKRSALVKGLPATVVKPSLFGQGAVAPTVAQTLQPSKEAENITSAAAEVVQAPTPPPTIAVAPKAAAGPTFAFSAALPILPQAPMFTLKQETVIARLETDIDEQYVEDCMLWGIKEAEERRLVRIERAGSMVKSRAELKAARERRADLKRKC